MFLPTPRCLRCMRKNPLLLSIELFQCTQHAERRPNACDAMGINGHLDNPMAEPGTSRSARTKRGAPAQWIHQVTKAWAMSSDFVPAMGNSTW